MLPGPKSNVPLRRRRLRRRHSHVVAVVMTGALLLGLAAPVSATTATNTTTAAVVPQSPVNYGTVVNFVAQVTSGLGLKRAVGDGVCDERRAAQHGEEPDQAGFQVPVQIPKRLGGVSGPAAQMNS